MLVVWMSRADRHYDYFALFVCVVFCGRQRHPLPRRVGNLEGQFSVTCGVHTGVRTHNATTRHR